MTTRTLTFIAVAAAIAVAWIALAPRVAPPPDAVEQAGLTVRTPPAAPPSAPAPSTAPAVVAAPAPAALAPRAHVRPPVAPSSAVPSASVASSPVEPATVEATPVGPPGEPGAIQGTLTDASGQPLSRVTVFAVAADGEDAVEDVTDDGRPSAPSPGETPSVKAVAPRVTVTARSRWCG
ncbi:MAG: hypothetical protein U0229_09665 [Anaeromyxobacter sp.]